MASFASTVAPGGCVAGVRRCSIRVSAAMAVAPPPPATARTHYEVLGVGAAASRGEIKAAYRRLAREVHPDASVSGGGVAGGEDFIRLHAAYATLADPDERARYDRAMAGPAAMLRRAPAPSFRRRTWETDQCW
uniref:J domain-containing protein n=1 Tax=Leersia perrieri TaxID=77586 RepID=A0A0D9WU64_9ORYZ